MNAFTPAARALIEASTANNQLSAFGEEVEGVINTIEHLAVQAAHAGEPCARVLFSVANLLRTAVLDDLS